MTSTSIEEELEKVIHRALADSRNAGGAPLGLMDGLEAFLAAINWTEPFIIGVLACHVIFLLVAIFGRKQTGIQIGLLVLALAGVLSASHLNAYGRLHWKSLGVSQNYFDQTGVFVSCLWSAPLALISFGILINSVWNASDLLITVKRQQLGVNKRTKATSNGGAASASAAAAAPAEPLDQEVRTTAATAPTSAIKQRKVKSKG